MYFHLNLNPMKQILVILIVVFVLLQFFQIDKTNPPVNKGMDFLSIKNVPQPLADKIRSSCYDCHSDETIYPVYSYLQPFGWFLKSHIDEGRKELNFSTFATYEPSRQAHKLAEASEMLERHAMPLDSYTMIHTDANLSEKERADLIDFFRKTEQEIRIANQLPPEKAKPSRK